MSKRNGITYRKSRPNRRWFWGSISDESSGDRVHEGSRDQKNTWPVCYSKRKGSRTLRELRVVERKDRGLDEYSRALTDFSNLI